jgi:4-hydroxybenzoate polyprenyltransferase
VLVSTNTASWPTAWKALRARQWLHFLFLPAASMAGPLSLLHGIAVAACALAYAYGLNAISDRVTDLDVRKNPLVGATSAQLPALLSLLLLAALGLGALAGATSLEAAAISLLASTVYSVGPRLKRVPLLGTLLNLAMFAPLLLVAPGAAPSPSLRLLGAAFATLLVQNQLLHERADAVEDAAAHARTTGRVLGEGSTHLLVLAVGVAGAALLGGVAAAAIGLVTAASLLPCSNAAARRVRHRWLALLAGAILFGVSR